MDDQEIKDWVPIARQSFATWSAEGRKIASMLLPTTGQVLTAAQLRGEIVGNPENANAFMSEYVSARMTIIKQNFVERAISFQPKIEAEVISESAEEQAKQKLLFQCLHGFHNVLNERQQATLGGTSWDRMILEYIFTFGKAMTIPLVSAAPGGTITFQADLFDPLNCFHDFDSHPWRWGRDYVLGIPDARRELDWYVRERNMPASSEARELLTDKKDTDSVQMTNVWVEELDRDGKATVYQGFEVDGIVVGSYKTDFLAAPHVIQTVHSAPGTYIDFTAGTMSQVEGGRGVHSSRILHHAGSLFAPMYHINQQFRQFMSLMFEGIARSMAPGMEFILREGSQAEVPGPEKIGPNSGWAHGPDIDMKVQAQATQTIAQAADLAFRAIDAEFDRLANPVIFGQSNPGDSGYLQVNKVSHAGVVTRDSVRGASLFEKRTYDQFIAQFIMPSQKLPFKVSPWKLQGKGAPQFFPGGDFTKAMLPKQYVLNVEMLTDLPQNDAAKMDIFLAGAGKAFSLRQGRMNILDDDDPDLTQSLIDQDEYDAMPPVKNRKMLKKAREEVAALWQEVASTTDPIERRKLEFEARIAEADYEVTRRQLQGQVENRLGQPEAPSRFPPGTLPPEQAVGLNPDQNAEAQGRVSSSLAGKPRTAEVA